jgi:hypothetical protein
MHRANLPLAMWEPSTEDMASDWLLAATLLEDVLIPAKQAEQTSAQTPQP